MDYSAIIRASLLEVYPNQVAIMKSLATKLVNAAYNSNWQEVEATLMSVSVISKVCAEMVREENTNEALV